LWYSVAPKGRNYEPLALPFTCISCGFASSYTAGQSKSQIERGQYLVVEVAHCGDCHTPMNDKGEPIQDRWLKGAVLSFKPTSLMPWADQSANIAGLPGWKPEDAVSFLMTGKHLGKPPLPPMPEYHLTKADAEAVVAYLRSLAPSAPQK
jgi:mono/diheme cytochrome c family protein